jgi:hypothetical protein
LSSAMTRVACPISNHPFRCSEVCPGANGFHARRNEGILPAMPRPTLRRSVTTGSARGKKTGTGRLFFWNSEMAHGQSLCDP